MAALAQPAGLIIDYLRNAIVGDSQCYVDAAASFTLFQFYVFYGYYINRQARYKQAIKEAAANLDRAFNDGLFDKLCKKDNVGFWKT